jgi:hypothetical protein
MRRRLLNLTAAVALVLCVAAVALWVRSYRVSDQWFWVDVSSAAAPQHRLSLLSHSGQFSVSWLRTPLKPPDRYRFRFVHEAKRPPVQFWWKPPPGTGSFLRFWNRRGFAAVEADVHAPAWCVVVAFAGLAIVAARPRRRGLALLRR